MAIFRNGVISNAPIMSPKKRAKIEKQKIKEAQVEIQPSEESVEIKEEDIPEVVEAVEEPPVVEEVKPKSKKKKKKKRKKFVAEEPVIVEEPVVEEEVIEASEPLEEALPPSVLESQPVLSTLQSALEPESEDDLADFYFRPLPKEQ